MPPRGAAAGSAGKEDTSRWVCVYPIYLDASRTLAQVGFWSPRPPSFSFCTSSCGESRYEEFLRGAFLSFGGGGGGGCAGVGTAGGKGEGCGQAQLCGGFRDGETDGIHCGVGGSTGVPSGLFQPRKNTREALR